SGLAFQNGARPSPPTQRRSLSRGRGDRRRPAQIRIPRIARRASRDDVSILDHEPALNSRQVRWRDTGSRGNEYQRPLAPEPLPPQLEFNAHAASVAFGRGSEKHLPKRFRLRFLDAQVGEGEAARAARAVFSAPAERTVVQR